jgi:hypothetical protein
MFYPKIEFLSEYERSLNETAHFGVYRIVTVTILIPWSCLVGWRILQPVT